MPIPTPTQLGIDLKAWRPTQEEGINVMITSQKRITTICAPTGWGKTWAIIAAAILSKKPTCIVTASRGLQDQYMAAAESLGLVDIRGRKNYTCEMRDDFNCEEGGAARCAYKGTIGCPSSQAEMRAATSSLVITNYSKWCASRKFGQGMAHFQQVIFDEGHESFNALASAMQVILNHREIEKDLEMDFLSGSEAEEFANWRPWAALARATAEQKMIIAQARITGVADPKPAWVRHFTHMRNLTRRLSTLATASMRDWIVEEIKEGYQFDPIRPGKYAEAALLLRVPRIIFMSATIRPKSMYMIGQSKESFDFKEFDSDFDPKRAPFYYIPTQRVDAKHPDNRLLWARHDQIAAKRQDRKGIVHTVSYARQGDIQSISRYSSNMLINPQGEPPTEMVEQFMESGPGTELVSPSVGTGYDFKDDYCRWQFLCKIPYEPPSKIVKAREADDKDYRPYRAMQTLVQNVGRDVRSKTDWSERFIGDDNAEWFFPRYGHFAPKSFHAVLQTVKTLPQPFPLEGPKI